MVTEPLKQALLIAKMELERSGQFDLVTLENAILAAHANDAPDGAFYRIELHNDGVYVTWVSADRYLSQSIEQDLVFSGDDLDDMIDEELVDTGYEGARLAPMQHYRNDEKMFIFRSRTPIDPGNCEPTAAGASLAKFVLAYEAAIRQLGDMSPDEED